MRILTIFGTRPEAIKLAPVVHEFQAAEGVEHATCVTGQHREMLDQVLRIFEITPDFDLEVMRVGQDLTHITTEVLQKSQKVFREFRPDWVIVQGDTTTAFAAALSAFYGGVRVAHVEAGLRTGNVYSPWPEEMNRKLVTALSSLHFAPTSSAASNLSAEGVAQERIFITGNTVIDALHWVSRLLERDPIIRATCDSQFAFLDPRRRLIVVTGHRRESFDGGLERVCRAIKRISDRVDVEVIYPVHLNPRVQATATRLLCGRPNVHLIGPVDYLPFVRLMQRAYLIVTDSGGIQEEAPALGKPVLVTRDTTERPEAIESGTARLVGTEEEALVCALTDLLDNEQMYSRMAKANNPFGDGRAATRIVQRTMANGAK